MLLPEKKIQWHPTVANRFVVGGGSPIGQVKVYDWDGKTEITEVVSLGDLQHMRCFAISPHPTAPDLIAVGNSLGKVDLMRYNVQHPPNAIRSPVVVTLPVRTSRACNCLSFSSVDPNYLAVGLDKVRGDPSLVVWDVESGVSTLSLGTGPSSRGSTHLSAQAFAQSHSNPLFSRPSPLLPAHQSRTDKSMLQTWSHNEVVTSISFLPSSKHFLLAGVSHRWLRLFDFRYPYSQSNPLSTNTKSVHGITCDPFDPNRFACFGDDGAVRVWDIRRFSAPVLTFSERDAGAGASAGAGRTGVANALVGLEYCKSRRGVLATLEKDGSVVRVWDTVRATILDEKGGEKGAYEAGNGEGGQGKEEGSKISKLAKLAWTTGGTPSGEVQAQREGTKEGTKWGVRVEQLVLCNTKTSSRFLRPLSSFVFIPPNSLPYTSSASYTLAVVTKDGDLDMQTLYDAPLPHWSSRGELSIGSGKSHKFYQPYRGEIPAPDPWNIVPPPPPLAVGGSGGSPFGSVKGRQVSGLTVAQSQAQGQERGMPSNMLGIQTQTQGSQSLNVSARRSPFEKSSAQDTTPRPGHLALRPEQQYEGQERRGRTTADFEGQGQKVTITVGPRSSSKGKLTSDERTSRRVVMDDISMVMRRRAIKGYGLENLVHNADITRAETHSETLSELWLWIESSRHILAGNSRVHGFEFANQGVLGIWEGFTPMARPSSVERDSDFESARADLANLFVHDEDEEGYRTPGRHNHRNRRLRRTQSPSDQSLGDFAAAVHALNLRRGYDRTVVARVAVASNKLAQRRFCLTLCGWNYGDDELMRAAARWEKEGRLTKAACWLLFTDHQDKAVECLMRSDDERLRIMSGTLSALLAQRNTSNQVKEHYNRLIVRIEDPYLRIMLTHVALDDWQDVLQEESLPLRERLAIAFRFLDDRSLSSYLRQLSDKYRMNGDIEGLILTGLTQQGFEVIQAYVDTSGDIQTASILAAFVSPGIFRDTRAERWLEAYHTLLDGWKLFHHRCQFDISRGVLIKEAMARDDISPFDWVPPQLAVKCGFCKKTISSKGPMAGPGTKIRVNSCQTCGRSLPRCAICLTVLGLGFGFDAARDAELAREPDLKDTMDEALVFCQNCKHGGHASHMFEWFYGSSTGQGEGTGHDECPVAGCECRCALE
ncbi:hypothetical protein M422DRAFT_777349 [Sphaerobolus stellatus SS14]|nr:hypothetical protein M422DRAFT_777349 [Sphaerobolus stellatus SS14]